MTHYILASGSPRRKELLKSIGIDFEILIPESETSILNKVFKYSLVENNAKEKGFSVLKNISGHSIIISADTVVVYNNIILGKPENFDDAFRMLKLLSGNTHKVVTSICVTDSISQKYIIKSETSAVTFNDISEDKLKDYIYRFRPYDKAGSYGIQELEASFIKNITGDYDNIVGLPVKMLKNILCNITNREIRCKI